MRPVQLRAPEVRTYNLRLADVDTTDALTFLEGRAVPYGEETLVGWYWEQHAPRVFEASLSTRLPLLLWHNGRSWPVGVADEWREADDGLHGVWRLDASDDAQRAARQARDGFLTGMSVGFDPRKSAWTYTPYDDFDFDDPATYDRVTRTEARLVEVSLVPTPAFESAEVTLVRSAERRTRRTVPAYATRRQGVAAAAAAGPVSTPHLDRWRAYRDTLHRA